MARKTVDELCQDEFVKSGLDNRLFHGWCEGFNRAVDIMEEKFTSDNKQSMAALEASIHSWFAKYTNFDITMVMVRDLRQRLNAAK